LKDRLWDSMDAVAKLTAQGLERKLNIVLSDAETGRVKTLDAGTVRQLGLRTARQPPSEDFASSSYLTSTDDSLYEDDDEDDGLMMAPAVGFYVPPLSGIY